MLCLRETGGRAAFPPAVSEVLGLAHSPAFPPSRRRAPLKAAGTGVGGVHLCPGAGLLQKGLPSRCPSLLGTRRAPSLSCSMPFLLSLCPLTFSTPPGLPHTLPERWRLLRLCLEALLLQPFARLCGCDSPHKISLTHTDLTVCCRCHTHFVVTCSVMCTMESHTLGSCTVRCCSCTHLESTDPEITHLSLHSQTARPIYANLEVTHADLCKLANTFIHHRRTGSHLGVTVKWPHAWISVTLRCHILRRCTLICTSTHNHHIIDLETTCAPPCHTC